jgi:hypothetical protein
MKELMDLSLEEIEKKTHVWNVERMAREAAEERAEQEKVIRRQNEVVEALARQLPVALRPYIEFRYFYSSRYQDKAGLTIKAPTWRVWVDMTASHNGGNWDFVNVDGLCPFAPLQPEIIQDEDTGRWKIGWSKFGGNTDNLLEAVVAAKEMAAQVPALMAMITEKNIQLAEQAQVQEPVYEAVDKPEGEHAFMDELITLIRDVVREELETRVIA